MKTPHPEARARCPASCGELVQGVLDGRDFLITNPINLFAEAHVRLRDEPELSFPSHLDFSKSHRAARMIFDAYNPTSRGAEIQIETTIPRGKGMSSSSADLASVAHASAEALGCPLPALRISQVCAQIEPTDALFHRGIVIYDQIRGELIEMLGDPPPIRFCVVDTGGTLETHAFDREKHRAVARKHKREIIRAISLVRTGIARREPRLVAKGATISALYHQEVLFKETLESLLHETREVGALGVNIAHSGTVVGVMYDPRTTSDEAIQQCVERIVPSDSILGCFDLISGRTQITRSSRVGLSPEQQRCLDRFGEPVARIERLGEGFVLEFQGGQSQGESFFIHPDGTRSPNHPRPFWGEMDVRPKAVARAGELWRQEVRIQEREGGEIYFSVASPIDARYGALHVMEAAEFEREFQAKDDLWVQEARIAGFDGERVHLVPDREGRKSGQEFSLPAFLAQYAKIRGPQGEVLFPVDMRLFDETPHNPSTFAILRSLGRDDVPILDFCVPVNPYFPTPRLEKKIRDRVLEAMRLYPSLNPTIAEALARLYEFPPDRIIAGNGSTELMTWIDLLFVRAGLAVSVPTFGRWISQPRSSGKKVFMHQLAEEDNFDLDAEAFVRFVRDSGCDVAVVVNPNNPTARFVPLESVRFMAKELSHLALFVIDESFIDFVDIDGIPTMARDIDRFPNLFVLKSLGKNLGLHGLRFGLGVAQEEIIARFGEKMTYWNVNAIAEMIAFDLEKHREEYEESRRRVIQDRMQMETYLRYLSEVKVIGSSANFILLKILAPMSATYIRDALLTEHGIFVRDCGNKDGIDSQYLRVACRTDPDNRRFVEAVRDILESGRDSVPPP